MDISLQVFCCVVGNVWLWMTLSSPRGDLRDGAGRHGRLRGREPR
eukprot:COSAG06_NODE_52705_length_304_cov_0.756098_1_plen_44_part_10